MHGRVVQPFDETGVRNGNNAPAADGVCWLALPASRARSSGTARTGRAGWFDIDRRRRSGSDTHGVVATRATVAPVIDGRDDDAVWRTAPAITQFRVFRPVEDGEPKFRTEAKVAYDAHYLYVFVRAFDPHPDSIVGLACAARRA